MVTVQKMKDFQNLLDEIPKLSKPYSISKDFPGPGKMDNFSNTFNDFKEVWQPNMKSK